MPTFREMQEYYTLQNEKRRRQDRLIVGGLSDQIALMKKSKKTCLSLTLYGIALGILIGYSFIIYSSVDS